MTEVFKEGKAAFVHYTDADGTYEIKDPYVTIYFSGIVHVIAEFETSTFHISSVEILWTIKYADNQPNVRLLRAPKIESDT